MKEYNETFGSGKLQEELKLQDNEGTSTQLAHSGTEVGGFCTFCEFN